MASADRRPKALFLTASYPTAAEPTRGIFVREHARAAARHADVAVVHLHRTDRVRGLLRLEREEDADLPTWRVDYPRRPLPLSYIANLAAAAAGLRAARRSGFRPDLLHAHFFLAAVPAVVLGAAMRLPVVTTEHWSVFLPDDPARLSRLNLRLAKLAFERSAVVLPVSVALRDAIRAAGIEARFVVVPNAVDGRLFHPAAAASRADGAARRLLTVGGIYDAKGHEYLLDAVARLVARGLPVHLDIVGDGPLRSECERRAESLGLAQTVVFHGERPKHDVADFMRRADLFVLSSRYENNPCAVLEALASGLPVVATRVGGVPEVVGSDAGLLAEPCDADDLAGRIQAALERLGAFDTRAIAAAAASRYGLDSVGEALGRVYAEALAARLGRAD